MTTWWKWGLWLLMGVVAWRIEGWYQADRKLWCENCYIKLEMRLMDEAESSWNGWKFRYRNHHVLCPNSKKNNGCEELSRSQFGDKLRLWGQLITDDYGNRKLVVTQVESVKRSIGLNVWTVVKAIRRFRTRLDSTYKLVLGEPHASLLAGITLGKNEKMTDWFYQALIDTGTIHVVAASGFNVTIVAKVILSSFLLVASRKKAVVMALVAVGLYVLLAGAGPAVVRAGIMGTMVFIAQAFGRDYWAGWGLFISSLLMLLIAPWMIVDISFQLSVMATAGIVFGSKRLTETFCRLRWPGLVTLGKSRIHQSICGDLGTTLAATIATLPIILIQFGRVSLIAPIVNVLVAGLIPPLMFFGSLVALFGLVSTQLAQVVAWVSWPLLTLFIEIVHWFSLFPWASIG